ncbi:MAG TPA: cell division protein FtsQ/DivIB [Casimicrobiaceae bacterium]|jgi:cell division protein FtsQ
MWDNPRQLNAVALIVAAAAVAILAAAGVNWAVRQPVFALREVVVRGPLERVNPAHIEAVVREELRGTFFTLRLADARVSISRVPWVRSAVLRRAWPLRLEITVSEQEPLARWNDGALVNVQGETFVADYDGELPQFIGPEGSSAEVTARFREFGEALSVAGLSIAELRLSERSAWELRTEGEGAMTLALGRAEPATRLERFVAYYPSTIGRLHRSGARVDRVDLRYRNGFAARLPAFKDAALRRATAQQAQSRAQGKH